MPRNVEIKARVKHLEKVLSIARQICSSEGEILKQEDTFFRSNFGRLKLRQFEDGQTSQLVFYDRPDTEGPKVSNYSISNVENPDELVPVLKSSLGVIGVVKKIRHLFLYGQTRIHIDKVVNLGEFLELEVVLTPDQTLGDGQQIAEQLMQKLEIDKEDLLSGAYLDQLKK